MVRSFEVPHSRKSTRFDHLPFLVVLDSKEHKFITIFKLESLTLSAALIDC